MYKRIRKPFLYGTYFGAWGAFLGGMCRVEENPIQGAIIATTAIIYITIFMHRNRNNHDLGLD